jgi:PAS domain S-box-containing protein
MVDNIKADIDAVNRMPLMPALLEVVCSTTGMGFAAIARVTSTQWVACSVRDEIDFGLLPGGELTLETTICNEIRLNGREVIIDHVSADEHFKNHPTPAMYGFESYISFPIFLKDGSFFGTLCAIHPKPAKVNTPAIISMFRFFTDLVATHLSMNDRLTGAETSLLKEQGAARVQQDFNAELTVANQKLAQIQKDLEATVNQLTETNAKLQQAIVTGNMGTWSINPANHHVSISEYVKELFGFLSDKEISIEQMLTAVDPEYHDNVRDVLLEGVNNQINSDIEYPITNIKTNERKWVRATGMVCFDKAGNFVEYSGMLMDITERKHDEDQEAMLAAIIQSSEDAIVSKTLDGIITSWNTSAVDLFGFSQDEAVGSHISIIIPEDRLSEETLIISKVRNSERVEHFETIRRTKSNEEIPISVTVSPILNEQGKVIGASKIARDIRRQKIAEERLQNYAEHMEILNSIGQTISADLDTQSILQKVTDATTQLTGAAFGAFFHNLVNEKGESYTLYTLSGAPREAFEKFGMPRNTAVFGATFNGEGIVRVDDITKDPRYGHNAPHNGMPEGHLPVVSYLAVPVKAKTGEVIGGLFFGHPKPGIFKKEHEQLIAGVAAQASVALDNAKLYDEIKKLNAKKDEFIGLASHELKTPVTSINGYLQIIQKSMPADDRNKNFVGKALSQVGKLTTLISDLLDVSKIQTGKLPFSYTTFDMVELLNDVTDMMQQTYNSHKIELNYSTHPIIIKADHQRMEQVIINLITNAAKYSPGTDKIVITASVSDNKLQVGVKDFGIGIAKDQQDRIFSRFYRVENLASHMSGLGIGLYICHEIISRHKGHMRVESELGKGSTFSFELPLAIQ